MGSASLKSFVRGINLQSLLILNLAWRVEGRQGTDLMHYSHLFLPQKKRTQLANMVHHLTSAGQTVDFRDRAALNFDGEACRTEHDSFASCD